MRPRFSPSQLLLTRSSRRSVGPRWARVALFAKAIARQRRISAEAAEHQKLVAQFTPRELEVLRLMAEGLDTETMAGRLGIAAHTVQWHVRHVIEKLQVHSKLQAVIEGARKGLIAF